MATKLEVQILGDFKDLAKATRGAEGQLKHLNKKVAGFSRSMKGSLATIGIGLGFNAIADALKDATKAAMDDTKSQAVLKTQLQNTTKISDKQVEAIDKQIQGYQKVHGVLDDDLRPAFGKIYRSTKDSDKAFDGLTLALDIAAATGKPLATTSDVVSKALAGNTTALTKLVPSLKGVEDPLGKAKELFAGVSEEAAKNDPLARINTIFADIQEEVGLKLLPYLEEFADWLASDEGSQFLDNTLDTIKAIIDGIATIIKGFSDIQTVGNQVNSDPEVNKLLSIVQPTNNATGLANIDRFSGNFSTVGSTNTKYKVPKMATGGIVMPSVGGSIVNVAEAGQPEAIIPLDRLNAMNAGNTYNVYFTKATPNPSEIVATLKNYERQTGTKILK